MNKSRHELPATIQNLVNSNNPFAIVQGHRKEEAHIFTGNVIDCELVDDIPRRTLDTEPGKVVYDALGMVPYSQIRELGYECHEDESKIRCMQIREQMRVGISDLLNAIPNEEINMERKMEFEDEDAEYEEIVRNIIDREIGEGNASTVVICSKAVGKIANMSPLKALNIFKKLLLNEYGAYMTFFFFDGTQYFIGASPERHLAVNNGMVGMNPISGTFRKANGEIDLEAFIRFLKNPKEINELFMCMDEELKQMAEMCNEGGRIIGPSLKEMAHLVHTEYQLVGKSDKSVRELLKLSMHAPTVTGSPRGSASGIISNYENSPRGYYSGEFFITCFDELGNEALDSAIAIRTINAFPSGLVTMRAGASIVRDSIPAEEAKERRAKAECMNKTLNNSSENNEGPVLPSQLDANMENILAERNIHVNGFLFNNQEESNNTVPELVGTNIVIIDNEDGFSYLIKHMINAMGANVTLVSYKDYDINSDKSDIVIVGPGPGNPLDEEIEKMEKLGEATTCLLEQGRKFMSICLGHQKLCELLGFEISKKKIPTQGVQKTIDLFGKEQNVGFYNTFAAIDDPEREGLSVEACCDPESREIHALRGENFSGFQFHAESIFSENGFDILKDELKRLI